MRRIATWLGWLLVMGSGIAAAAAPSVPPPLQDWQAWVLHGHEQQTCALLVTQPGDGGAERQCVWPTRLALAAGKAGAQFRLDLHAGAESWVALPHMSLNERTTIARMSCPTSTTNVCFEPIEFRLVPTISMPLSWIM